MSSRPAEAAPAGRRRRSSASPARTIARIAVFAALMAALGLMGPVPVPVLPVPITAQSLGVMLAGAVLGPWAGAASMALFELLVLIGLPLMAGGRGGIGVFVGPSAGYVYGYIVGALVVGLCVRYLARRPHWWTVLIGVLVGGIGVVYACGIPVQAAITGMPLAVAAKASMIFLIGDSVKAVVAVLVVMGLWKAYPAAFR